MLNCKFILELPNFEKVFNSEQELNTFLNNNYDRLKYTLKGGTDVKFSKIKNIQEEVISKLKTFKDEGSVKLMFDEQGSKYEVVIDQTQRKGYRGISRLVENLEDQGRQLFIPVNTDNYKKFKLQELVATKVASGMSTQDALIESTTEVNNIVKGWGMVSTMGTEVHFLSSIFFDNHKTITKDVLWALYQTTRKRANKPIYLTEEVVGKFYDIFSNIKKEFIISSGDPNIEFMTEVPLYDEDTKHIGIVDLIAIRSDGKTYISDFKTSYKKHEDWDRDKVGKYQHQLAGYNQLMSQQGVQIADSWIIPLHLEAFDDVSRVIQDVTMEPFDKLGVQFASTLVDVWYRMRKELPTGELVIEEDGDDTINKEINNFFNLQNNYSDEEKVQDFLKNQVRTEPNGKKYYLVKGRKKYLEPVIANPITKEQIEANKFAEIINRDGILVHLGKLELARSGVVSQFKERFNDAKNDRRAGKYKNPFGGLYDKNGDTVKKAIYNYLDGHWEIVEFEELEKQGIISFKNIYSNHLEFLSITNESLTDKVKLKYGENLTGNYIADSVAVTNDWNLPSEKKYIEAIKVLSFLNKNAEILESKGLTVHMIRVLNPTTGQLEYINIKRLKRNYEYLAGKHEIPVNLHKIKLTSTASVLRAAIKAAHDTVTESSSMATILKNIDDTINTPTNNLELRNALVDVAKAFRMSLGDAVDSKIDTSDELQMTYGALQAYIAELSASDIHNTVTYNAEHRNDLTVFSASDSTLFSGFHTIRHDVIKTALMPIRSAMNAMAHNYMRNHDGVFRPIFKRFYEAQGTSTLIGDHTKAFKNLFERDKDGNITKIFRFKDPDAHKGDNTYLSEPEREFLRDVLPKIAEYLYGEHGIENAKLTGDYFNVPLKRISSSSRVQLSFGAVFSAMKDTIVNLKETATTEVELFPEQEEERRKASLSLDTMFDEFSQSKDAHRRKEVLNSRELSDFELNIEYIFNALAYSTIKKQAYDGALPIVNAILTTSMLYDMGFSNKNVENVHKYVRDHVKMAVFQEKDLENDNARKVHNVASPIKHFVSMAQLGLAPLNIIRETLQGTWANMTKIMAKRYGEGGPSMSDWFWAVKKITLEGPEFLTTVTLTEALNHEYRLANMDTHQLNERVVIAKTGATQFANRWFLWAMGAPDYINRMTFLLAKMRKDGSYEAHSVENESLVYDWTKDKRFSVYAAGDKSHPDYNKQRGLYLTTIEEFNSDTLQSGDMNRGILKEGDPLPMAYTTRERESIKSFINYLHGSYDHEDRIHLQNTLYGVFFMQFRTWLTAKVQQWYLKSDTYHIGSHVHAKDAQGNLLYRKWNGVNYDIVTEDTGLPYMAWEGKLMEGIWQSFLRTRKMLTESKYNFVETFKKAKADPEIVSNFKMAISDLLLYTLLSMAFKGLIDWDELKEDERLAYGLLKPVEASLSDLYFWNNFKAIMDPTSFIPAASFAVDAFDSTIGLASGEKNWKSLLTSNFAFARNLQNTTYLLDD